MEIPTTNQMDKTTTTDRYDLVALCKNCGEPHHFTGDREKFLQLEGETCDGCGSDKLHKMQTVRTYAHKEKIK